METKKQLLAMVENLKGELKSHAIAEAELKSEITSHKRSALAKCQDLESVLWKIKQADFISSWEKQRHQKSILMVEESRKELDNFEASQVLQDILEIENVEEFSRTKDRLKSKLCELRGSNDNMKISIEEAKQALTVLQKRNSAMMRKLLKQRQELDNQGLNLTARLEALDNSTPQNRGRMR